MYIGATTAVLGAALYYRSWALLGFAGAFLLVCHAFVRLYEEPALHRMFGSDYDAYCRHVHRWRPAR